MPNARRLLGAGALIAALLVGSAIVAMAPAPGPAPSQPDATSTPPTTSGTATPTSWQPRIERSGPGYAGIARWSIPALSPTGSGAASTTPAPAVGEVGSVVIPGTRSHFDARPAIVYLPPAALVGHPRRLPVVVALSGQSRHAAPSDVIGGGRIAAIMDGIARRHGGVAPIVVVPDQLGAGPRNPMCVDSPLGNVATYLTVDVRRWITTHLPVAADRKDWTIAGFSEGGTCSIQLGAGRPDMFGSLVDVSGEEAPQNGSIAHTIAVGFRNSRARYAAASPFRLLAAHHYTGTQAYFAVGALDTHYGAVAPVMAAHARAAGMTTHLRRLAGLKHNWLTGTEGLAWGLDALQTWWPAEPTPPHG
jgi:enterochelin esterase-like enzyme